MGTREKEYVAVYGTLMAGECNERWAKDAVRHPGWMFGRLYDTGYGFPAFIPRDPQETGTAVACELLETDEAGIAHMDILEGYPRLYRRERVIVNLTDGKIDGQPFVTAWVYVMNTIPSGAKQIKGGDWREYRKARMEAVE